MAQFKIQPKSVTNSGNVMVHIAEELLKQALGIDDVKDNLDPSYAEVAMLLATVAGTTRVQATSSNHTGTSLINIANTYTNCEAAVLGVLEGGLAPGTPTNSSMKDRIQHYELNEGEKKNRIKALQKLLRLMGYNISVDGCFGPKTAAALRDFQEKHGLTPYEDDGNYDDVWVDDATFEALFDATDKDLTERMKAKYGDKAGLDLDGDTVSDKSDWLDWAAAQNGYHEVGDNGSPFGQLTGTDGKAWCASFVSWSLYKSGNTTLPYTASTAQMKAAAEAAGIYNDYTKGSDYIPQAGDVFYKTRDGGGHVGFISEITQNPDGTYNITTMEGNTGDQVGAHRYTNMSLADIQSKWGGMISMNREAATGNSDGIHVDDVMDSNDCSES